MVYVYGIWYTVYCGLYRYILLEVYGADVSLWPCRCQTDFAFASCPMPGLFYLYPCNLGAQFLRDHICSHP